MLNGKKICGILQETISLNSRKFLIIGIGVNIASNPNIKNKYKATNILLETKKKLKIKEILDSIISSYKKFFDDLNSYNYTDYKEKADLMALKLNDIKMYALIGDIGNTITKVCLIENKTFKIKKMVNFKSNNIPFQKIFYIIILKKL